jgi:hypothetical protein
VKIRTSRPYGQLQGLSSKVFCNDKIVFDSDQAKLPQESDVPGKITKMAVFRKNFKLFFKEILEFF